MVRQVDTFFYIGEFAIRVPTPELPDGRPIQNNSAQHHFPKATLPLDL